MALPCCLELNLIPSLVLPIPSAPGTSEESGALRGCPSQASPSLPLPFPSSPTSPQPGGKHLSFYLQIHETIESINQLKIQRDFMLSFSRDPKGYVQDLLRSQSRDLKLNREVSLGVEEGEALGQGYLHTLQ